MPKKDRQRFKTLLHPLRSGSIKVLIASRGLSQIGDQHSLGITIRNYTRNLRAADESSRATLRECWHDAGLDKLISIDELEKPLNE